MKLLFICTHNRCRSILAEAITRHLASPHIISASAGSNPAGVVHPLSLKNLNEKGVSTKDLASQSWDDFAHFEPDAIITLCDSAANESCPVWFKPAIKAHWGLPDPSKVKGSDNQQRDAFNQTIDIIERRIEHLLKLKISGLSNSELQNTLNDIAASIN